jgi:hypothetical protein
LTSLVAGLNLIRRPKVALDGFSDNEVFTMIERREYIDRIKAALDVWSDELLRLEKHVIEGVPGTADAWDRQRQELQRLLVAVQDNIGCLRRQQDLADSGVQIVWQQVCRDLQPLTDRLYPGN